MSAVFLHTAACPAQILKQASGLGIMALLALAAAARCCWLGAAGCVHVRARQSSFSLGLLTNLRSIAPPPSLGEVGAFSSMWQGMPLPSPLLAPPGVALHLLCALGVPKHMLSRVKVPRRLPPETPALNAFLAS